MKIKSWIREHHWLVLIFAAALVGVATYIFFKVWTGKEYQWGSKIVLLVLAALVGWFLDIFTGNATREKVDQMVAFCYVFPFAIFAGILIPLFAYPLALPDPPKPIGILLGCADRSIEPVDKDLVPDGIRCNNRSDQWLVNIGGNAVPVDKTTLEANEALSEAAAKAKVAADVEVRSKRIPEVVRPGDKSKPVEVPKPIEPTKPVETAKAIETANPVDTASSDKKGKDARADIEKHFRITGGLVVPLYFVILSIFGGFVSMLRRVPEYQERVSPGASDALSLDRAREKLVFEVLQLLAAPLIAITAYYLVDPTSRASSIALAFIAGFSSETVLLYVRAIAEKLQPQTVRRKLEVEVAPASLTFPTQPPGSTSPAQMVRLTNRTDASISGTVTVSGEFALTPSGMFTVGAGSTTTFSVTFKPQSPGKKTGEVQIADNVSSSPRIVPLSGEADGGI